VRETEGEFEVREDLVEEAEGMPVTLPERLPNWDRLGRGEELEEGETLALRVPVAVFVAVGDVPEERVPVGVFEEVEEKEGKEDQEGKEVEVLEGMELREAPAEREDERVRRGEEEEVPDRGPVAVALADLEFVELAVKVSVFADDLEEVLLGVTVFVPVVVFVAVFVEDPELVNCPVPVAAMEGFTPTNARSRGIGVASTRDNKRRL